MVGGLIGVGVGNETKLLSLDCCNFLPRLPLVELNDDYWLPSIISSWLLRKSGEPTPKVSCDSLVGTAIILGILSMSLGG